MNGGLGIEGRERMGWIVWVAKVGGQDLIDNKYTNLSNGITEWDNTSFTHALVTCAIAECWIY